MIPLGSKIGKNKEIITVWKISGKYDILNVQEK